MFVCSTAVTILPRLDFKTEAFFMKENKKNLSALLSNTMINFCELEVFIINFNIAYLDINIIQDFSSWALRNNALSVLFCILRRILLYLRKHKINYVTVVLL